jgi:hypothetical protein
VRAGVDWVRGGGRTGSKGNFQQTAGSIGSKLEKNIRFLIETTLPKISSSPAASSVPRFCPRAREEGPRRAAPVPMPPRRPPPPPPPSPPHPSLEPAAGIARHGRRCRSRRLF